jgi:uncharacterized protein (DUF2147 family)
MNMEQRRTSNWQGKIDVPGEGNSYTGTPTQTNSDLNLCGDTLASYNLSLHRRLSTGKHPLTYLWKLQGITKI